MNGFSGIKTLIRKAKSRVIRNQALPEDSKRSTVSLPSEGRSISVETALNSRCSSDYDNIPEVFHWGMFDRSQRLSPDHIRMVMDYANTVRLTSGDVKIESDGSMLLFFIDNNVSDIERDFLMIESGMQQQAAGLVCAALGIGNVLQNEGPDGRVTSENEYITARMRLDAMKPSYDGFYWSVEPPKGEAAWLSGNLPEPTRKSTIPLLEVLESFQVYNKGKTGANHQMLGQLLWAARGRTPHFYKSTPWGMTIPTWQGRRKITRTYLIENLILYEYINWYRSRPIHSISNCSSLAESTITAIRETFSNWNSFIVVSTNDSHARSLWETGYQLLNIIVQAHALELSYQVFLPDNKMKSVIKSAGVQNPAAIIGLQ